MTGKTIILDNDEHYIVVSETIYEDTPYILLAHIDYNKNDLDEDMIVAKSVNNEVEIVEDEALVTKILPTFNLD